MPLKPTDYSAIASAVATCPGCSPLAKESASELVEAWVREYEERDREETTLATECAFHIKLDAFTYIIGISDRLSQTKNGRVVTNEWKTTKGPNGWGWNETKWLQEIIAGVQLPTYALAVRSGRWFDARKKPVTLPITKGNVLVRVRAVTKCSPPGFWPSKASGVWEFDAGDLAATAAAYTNAARQIRALKQNSKDVLPWQATGRQCFGQFGRDCELLDVCQSHQYAEGEFKLASEGDLSKFGLKGLPDDDRLVVLSPTSYELWSLCAEKWRVLKGIGAGERESDLNLEIGSATHAGLAEFYRRLK